MIDFIEIIDQLDHGFEIVWIYFCSGNYSDIIYEFKTDRRIHD